MTLLQTNHQPFCSFASSDRRSLICKLHGPRLSSPILRESIARIPQLLFLLSLSVLSALLLGCKHWLSLSLATSKQVFEIWTAKKKEASKTVCCASQSMEARCVMALDRGGVQFRI